MLKFNIQYNTIHFITLKKITFSIISKITITIDYKNNEERSHLK